MNTRCESHVGTCTFGERASGVEQSGHLHRALWLTALLLSCTLIAWKPACAQLSAAAVTGLVHDASGAAVPNADIILRNTATSVEQHGQSNSAGNYFFRDVLPGNYTIETSAAGFNKILIAPFNLAVNQTATIDIVLEIGSVQQTVTVQAQAASIEASTAELGTVVGEKMVQDLPLNGRNFTALLALTPGASPISVAQNASGGNTKILPGASFSFPALNGQTNRSNLFLLDGLNNQEAEGSTYAYPPVIDQIEEFKVNSHNDEAQFGSVLGGTVNVVTKAGTNDVHGSLFEYVRNDAFNARNPFAATKAAFRQNQFGGSLGGPVYIPKVYHGKNKTFFFITAQGFTYSTPAQAYFRVPTNAELSGDLSDVTTQLYNPFTTRPDPNNAGKFLRDPFPSNQIPSNLLNSGAVAFAKAVLPQPISLPGSIGLVDNAVDNTATGINQEVYSVRIDQTFGSKDQVWGRYSGLQYTQTGSGGFVGLSATSTYPTKNYGVSWVHTFNPTLVMQAQYGRNTVLTTSVDRFSKSGLNGVYGLSGTFANSYLNTGDLFPSLIVTGYWSGGELNNIGYASDLHQYKASVTKILGKHLIGWGAEWNESTRSGFTRGSSITFTSTPTGNLENTAQPGNALASFLLSVPTGAYYRNIQIGLRPGGEGDAYVQDQWKVNNKLTLNVGLRYDLTAIPPPGASSAMGQLGGGPEVGEMDYSTGTYIVQVLPPACNVTNSAPCIPGDGTLPAHVVVSPNGKLLHNTYTNFGPRLGLAYRLSNNIAIRSGYGIVYDNFAAVTQLALNVGNGTWPNLGAQQVVINSPTPAQPTPNVSAQNPVSTGGGLLPAANPYNQTGYFADPHIKNPYSEQWNLDIQYELGANTVFSASYVGSESHRLDVGGLYNVAPTPGPGTPSSRYPWPYLVATNYDRSVGSGNYHSLQLSATRHFVNGWGYQVAYTWGKSIDEGASGWFGVENQGLQNPYDLKGSRSVSGFDVTNQLTFNTIYELPFGKAHLSSGNGVIDYIIGHWQTNAIFSAHTGQPYTLKADGDIANTGNSGYMRPNIVGNPTLAHPTPAQWFNTAAFAIPAPYTFGNVGRNSMRSAGYWNLDASVFRQFPIHDRINCEFRLEGFNVMNTVIYAAPASDISVPLSFGHVTGTANNPRVLQLAGRITF